MENGSQNKRSTNRFDYEKAYEDAGNPSSSRARQKSENVRSSTGKARSGTAVSHQKRSAAARRKRKQRKKRLTILAVICMLIIAAVIVLLVMCSKKKEPEEVIPEGIAMLSVRPQKASVDELYTYGTHLNLTGTLPAEVVENIAQTSVDLVLYNGDFIEVPLEIKDGQFTLSEYINGGLYLDEIPRDTYTMFIRVESSEPFEEEIEETASSEETTEDVTVQTRADGSEETTARRIEKKKPDAPTTSETEEAEAEGEDGEAVEREMHYRYYAIQNASDYPETVYYTLSRFDNRVTISSEYEYPTMQMEVIQNTDPDVYDIVIDPGHGGYDAGAVGIDDYCERDFTLPLSLKIKERLEAAGLTVALTRDSDANLLEPYGPDGRIARACSKHAKYLVSIHMNSSGAGGLEIYTASGIDYTFAESLRDSIQANTGLDDTLTGGTTLKDIFSRVFTQSDVEATIEDNIAEGLKPYEPQAGCSYYFVIRETGGIVTGAYTDDRNPDKPYNPYCYSNTCLESYITELGYITVKEDLELMINNMDGFAKGIADSLIAECGKGTVPSQPETGDAIEGDSAGTGSDETDFGQSESESETD